MLNKSFNLNVKIIGLKIIIELIRKKSDRISDQILQLSQKK